MKQKRFIKLLMSQGKQISQARKIALRYNSRKIPYSKAYADYLVRESLGKSFSRLGAAVLKTGIEFDKLSDAFQYFANTLKRQRRGYEKN